jgi:hypothetical protein
MPDRPRLSREPTQRVPLGPPGVPSVDQQVGQKLTPEGQLPVLHAR